MLATSTLLAASVFAQNTIINMDHKKNSTCPKMSKSSFLFERDKYKLISNYLLDQILRFIWKNGDMLLGRTLKKYLYK